MDLSRFEEKIYSQNGEDGIIAQIFRTIGTLNRTYVEFGAGDGSECNTHLLRERGWSGLLMDLQHSNPKIQLYREKVTAENIQSLLTKYSIPKEFDLLSIDIDSNDFYVWKALSHYIPRVVVIEYNGSHGPNLDRIIPYDPNAHWDGTLYYGASLLSLFRLGREKGYSLVYVEKRGVNAFFIRDDVLKKSGLSFKNQNDVQELYQFPAYGKGPLGGHPEDPKKRAFISSHLFIY